MLMTAAGLSDSLRAYKPRVFVNGKAIESVADEPLLGSGCGRCRRDLRFRASEAAPADHDGAPWARRAKPSIACSHQREFDGPALQAGRQYVWSAGRPAARQRYLTHDALNGLFQSTKLTDDHHGTDYSQRFLSYLHDVQDRDLTLGIAMTDAKGDRAPSAAGQQVNPDVYLHIKERRRTASSSEAPRRSSPARPIPSSRIGRFLKTPPRYNQRVKSKGLHYGGGPD